MSRFGGQADVDLLRTAWWSLKRGADALDACSDRHASEPRAAVVEMWQTMATIHERLEEAIGDPAVPVRLTTQEREFLLALVKHYGMQAVVAATALEPTSARVERAEMCAEIVLKLRKVT